MTRPVSNAPQVGATAQKQQKSYYFPVTGNAKYSDDYGNARVGHTHQGNDVFSAEGTPVVAVTSGRIYARWYGDSKGTIGWRVWLIGDDGKSYLYGHLQENSIVVNSGARVNEGEMLARVGKTGNAKTTPAHVHFEVYDGTPDNKKKRYNPFTWYKQVAAVKLQDVGTPKGYIGNYATLERERGKEATADVAAYNIKLNQLGYKGPSDNEFIAYALLNGISANTLAQTSGQGLTASERLTLANQRHDFETNIKATYKDMLGREPDAKQLNSYLTKFDTTMGTDINLDDVKLLVTNSKEYQQKVTQESTPQILQFYQEYTGLADASKTPGFTYVMGKIAHGEWDTKQAQNFIMQSPQATNYAKSQLGQQFDNLAKEQLGLATVSEANRAFAVNKMQQGWQQRQMTEYFRSLDDFKNRYPGIRDDESIDGWDARVAKLNAASHEYRGVSFDPWNNADDLRALTGGGSSGGNKA
ncbi:MAG TPA: M23 family metallopeptidase [Candidatus Aquicultor sp.]|jgi:hypothetical protein